MVVVFEYDDLRYSFSVYEFKYDTVGETLRYMLDLKNTFGDRYEVYGVEYINDFIREDKLSDTEVSLLYELLDYRGS